MFFSQPRKDISLAILWGTERRMCKFRAFQPWTCLRCAPEWPSAILDSSVRHCLTQHAAEAWTTGLENFQPFCSNSYLRGIYTFLLFFIKSSSVKFHCDCDSFVISPWKLHNEISFSSGLEFQKLFQGLGVCAQPNFWMSTPDFNFQQSRLWSLSSLWALGLPAFWRHSRRILSFSAAGKTHTSRRSMQQHTQNILPSACMRIARKTNVGQSKSLFHSKKISMKLSHWRESEREMSCFLFFSGKHKNKSKKTTQKETGMPYLEIRFSWQSATIVVFFSNGSDECTMAAVLAWIQDFGQKCLDQACFHKFHPKKSTSYPKLPQQ